MIDSQHVSEGEVIAVIANSANYKDMLYVESVLDNIKPRMLQSDYDFELPVELQFVEVQSSYFALVNAFQSYSGYIAESRQSKLYSF